jgi:hypothetical protein
MATVNLGRIKPIFKGAYAGGTAYVVDDIVTSGNETFICIQASTGNATSSATYWTKLASKGVDGSNGTNGTDVGTVITTQGDILYRDGSGLQRLAKPSSNKILQNTSGGVLSYIDAPSGKVKQVVVASNTSGPTSSSYDSNTSTIGNVGTSHVSVTITPLSSSSKFIMSAQSTGGTASNGAGYAGIFVDGVCRGLTSGNGYANDSDGMSVNAYFNNTNTNQKTVQFRVLGCYSGHAHTLGSRRSNSSSPVSYDGQYGNLQIMEVE